MKKIKPLDYKELCKYLDPHHLEFETTSELKTLSEFVGQNRAAEALNFGIRIKSHGYNLFAMGSTEIDKLSLIRTVLKEYAHTQKAPPDWCYVYNFEVPDKPIAIKLPPGLGVVLQNDMKNLIQELKVSILTIFESDEYRIGLVEIIDEFRKQQKNIPKKITKKLGTEIPYLYRERHEKEKKLLESLALAVVKPFIDNLKSKFVALPKVVSYLDAVQNDIVTHIDLLIKKDEISGAVSFDSESNGLVKYEINLLVNNHNRTGAPVIYEESPSFSNLISRVEYRNQFGTLITDFTLIKPGSLHRANGGFLLIDANKLIKNKFAWENLKIALSSRKIQIEPNEHLADTPRPISLKPKPIPLKIKVILIGSRNLYYKLCKNDLDFNELFKVPVDFDDVIERDKNTIQLYARLIATLIDRNGLRPFNKSAVAVIIDYSSRLAEDIEKLSTHLRRIDDLIQESDYWASTSKKKVVDAEDVKNAIRSQIYRLDRARELYYEDIIRNFILINTEDTAIGQINCLSVVRVGTFYYGHPTRVTTTIRIGRGKFIDIQREIKLAGPIHSKAGLILSSYLANCFSKNRLFSITITISFEQIYGMVDGDSASVAELCALLSALAEVPLKQSFAITGSINQEGEVQAIGSVNEKIEGYFDICKARGLTGGQGVIIPKANMKNLMLREDVIEAAKAKKFFIYPIETINDAMTILTGISAGERDENGTFPEASINYKVEAQLNKFSEHRNKNLKK